MKIWKIVLATLVIFGTGIITGGLLVGIADGVRERRHHWFEIHAAKLQQAALTNAPHETAPKLNLSANNPPRRAFPKDFLERLDRELKLTPDQHKQIDQVLDDGQKRTKEIWDRINPELREEMKKSREQIRDLLTPEQRTKFEDLMKARQPKPKEGQPKNNLPPALSATNLPAAQP